MVLERALRDGVLVLTMNRPEHRNALNRDLFRELGRAFVREFSIGIGRYERSLLGTSRKLEAGPT